MRVREINRALGQVGNRVRKLLAEALYDADVKMRKGDTTGARRDFIDAAALDSTARALESMGVFKRDRKGVQASVFIADVMRRWGESPLGGG